MHLSRLWKVNCDFVYTSCMHTGFLRNCKRLIFFFLHSSDILSVIVFPSGGVWEKKNSVCWHLRGTHLTQMKELCLYIRVLSAILYLSLFLYLFSSSLSLFFLFSFFSFTFDKPSLFFKIRPLNDFIYPKLFRIKVLRMCNTRLLT